MVNNSPTLDQTFQVLADPTRRAVIARLAKCNTATVSELASPFAMGLPAFLKHLKILEDSGLVASFKSGRVRVCKIRPEQIARAASWLDDLRRDAEARMDRFATYVEALQSHEGDKH